MKRASAISRQAGFSLLELMIASAIFILLCGAAFALLAVAQERYQTESQVLNSFQEARFGMDQMVRDVDDSGYPAQSLFSTLPPASQYAVSPVAWTPNYPATSCSIGLNCNPTPGDFDIIIESNVDPQNDNTVDWVRYQLQNTTLFRAVVNKDPTSNPDTATSGSFVPYVQNVMNNASPAQIAQIQASYPAMFPGGQPVAIFNYICDTSAGPQTCSAAGSHNSPLNIQDVEITLIVQAATPDLQTGLPRFVELHGRGHRLISAR
jgi:prepilin-type N-terminal cleavage/methylation domain-containing protein